MNLPLLATLLIAILTAPATAATRYVAECGNNGWFGLDPGCVGPMGPKRSIQTAINLAADGDTIIVLPGHYPESIDTLGKAIHIIGVGGADVTFVDADGSGRVLTCNSGEGADTIFEGLTFTGGDVSGDGAGALIALSSPRFIDCTFTGNLARGNGGAVSSQLASPSFEGCRFGANQAGGRGGAVSIAFGGTASFVGGMIEGNTCGQTGGGLDVRDATLQLTGVAINGNSAGAGGGMSAGGATIIVEGGSLTDNFSVASGGGLQIEESVLQATGPWAVSGNQAAGGGGGMRLISSETTLSSVQMVGNAVVLLEDEALGGGISVVDGSFEASALTITGNTAAGGGGAMSLQGTTAELSGITIINCSAPAGGGLWLRESAVSIDGGAISACEATLSGGAIWSYFVQLGVADFSINANTAGADGGGIAHERGEIALHGMNLAGNEAVRGGGVAIRGPLSSVAVIDDCQFDDNVAASSGGGVYLRDADLDIVGGEIDGGTAFHGGGVWAWSNDGPRVLRMLDADVRQNVSGDRGGGLYVGGDMEFVIRGGVMLSNETELFGGAIWCEYVVGTIHDVQISGNHAKYGGGIHATGEAFVRLANVLGTQNSAINLGGFASASDTGEIEMVNTTLALNSSQDSGGTLASTGITTMRLLNSIVVGTDAVFGSPSNFDARFSIVPTLILGPGCIDADPQFVNIAEGDFRLAPGSPAIDAGLNWLLPADTLDLDGNGDTTEYLPVDRDGAVRIQDSGGAVCGVAWVDMGAYEVAGKQELVPALGDIDGNGVVDFADVLLVLTAWGDAPSCSLADLNGDGMVSLIDLLIVLSTFEG